jgi:hypothetical protein
MSTPADRAIADRAIRTTNALAEKVRSFLRTVMPPDWEERCLREIDGLAEQSVAALRELYAKLPASERAKVKLRVLINRLSEGRPAGGPSTRLDLISWPDLSSWDDLRAELDVWAEEGPPPAPEPEWSRPDTLTAWARVFRLKRPAFKELLRRGEVRSKVVSKRRIMIALHHVPAPDRPAARLPTVDKAR